MIGKARRVGVKLKGKKAKRVKVPGVMLAGVRKSFASKGDDCTLTRFVKTGARKRKFQPLLFASERKVSPKKANYRAMKEGRSIFSVRGVKTVAELPTLLVSGHNNVKIGRDVRAPSKLFRGYWIYTLSFEERATCPRTCHYWETCYGNNMPYAKRIDHRDYSALVEKLEAEIHRLLNVRPSRGVVHKGALIRLHALGDFFSVEYVRFWSQMLALHDRLACYGYTAHAPDSEIGAEIAKLKALYGPRFAIRWSNGGRESDCTVPIQPGTERVENAFICPEQMNLADATGRAIVCATCGLCWSTPKNVAFMEH